jgi:DNA-directed RNA polymerase sigma subunit (sigma70/sigma32)
VPTRDEAAPPEIPAWFWPEVRDALSEREAEVLELRFRTTLTLDSIGWMFGCSKERIRQIIAKALSQLLHTRPDLEELLDGR